VQQRRNIESQQSPCRNNVISHNIHRDQQAHGKIDSQTRLAPGTP